MANGLAQNPFIRTIWSLQSPLRILASLRNKRFSYAFCRSNFLITTTSPRLFAVKTAPKLPLPISSLSQSSSHRNSGNSELMNSLERCLPTKRGSFLAIFWATHTGQLKTRVRINLIAAAQRFLWNILLQETSLKMICTSTVAPVGHHCV